MLRSGGGDKGGNQPGAVNKSLKCKYGFIRQAYNASFVWQNPKIMLTHCNFSPKQIIRNGSGKLLVSILFLFTQFVPRAQNQQAVFDSLVREYRQLNWNGVIYAGNKETLLYSKAFGYASLEQRKPMELNTLFKTESVGKMFTATRILQLAAAGKLKLSGTVAELLPEWNIPNAASITIRHLLTHSSGLSSPWEHPDYVFGKIYSKSELKKIIEEAPVIFNKPGEGNYYSNSGYMLMEEMIAKLDDQSFESSIQDHIFNPSGMKFTRSLNDSVLPASAAQPYYQVTADRFAPDNTRYGDGKASGAGGWMSTAGDLYLFARAWLNEKLLPRKWMEIQITNDGTVDSSSAFRRFGMAMLKERPPQTFILGHNGGGKGFSADVYFDYYKGDIVVFCSNQYAAGYDLTKRAFAILNKLPWNPPVQPDRIRLAGWLLNKAQEEIPPLNDAIFKELNIAQPGEFLFYSVFDNVTELGEHRAAAAVIQAGREKFPLSAYMWIKSGENAVAMNKKEDAEKYFGKALKLAEENKEKDLITVISKKMAILK